MSIVSAVTAISPLVIVLIVSTIVLGVAVFYLYDKQMKINKYAHLITMMAKADNKGGLPKPLGIIVDRSGKMIPFICEPDARNKGLLDDEHTLINPDLVKPSARSKFHRGPDTLFYPLPYFFPMSIHNSAALVQLAKGIRNNKYFNWIPNEVSVLCLLFNGTNTLYKDCLTIVDNAVKFGNEIPEFLLSDDYEDEEEYEEVEEEYEEEVEEENDDIIEGEYEEIEEEVENTEEDLLSEIATGEEVKSDD